MARNVLPQKIIKVVAAYKSQLQLSQIAFDRVLVFGSHAKKTAGKNSDIDIAVVFKKHSKDLHKEYSELCLATWYVDTKIEAHPIPFESFCRPDTPFYQEVKHYGIEV
jgi:predicted nucleotidyltransferase